ncbi:MAG: outer membrane protein transport protein [Deltaproteobacteria bacterium]|nr:outer membrane protein transport protein [Deltaproteobacteria bacterium]
MRRLMGIALAAAIGAFGLTAAADVTNYQKYVIGERALGMGGAQTAAVNDPMSCLYNPAGMVFAGSSMVSASKSIYSMDYRIIEGGFVPSLQSGVDAVSLEQENALTMPSTLALMVRFGPRLYKGGPKRHAIGISVLTPYQDSFTLRGKWKADQNLRDKENYSLSESSAVVWTGASYAFLVNEQLGLGASAFLVNSSWSRHLGTNRFLDEGGQDVCRLARCGYMEFKDSSFDSNVVSLLFQVGALWNPHENWRFGLTVRSPSIILGDLYLVSTEGSLDQTYGLARIENTDDDYLQYFSDTYKVKVAEYEPASIRAGYAFLWNSRFTIDLDTTVYLPVSFHRIRGDPVKDRYEKALDEGDDTVSPEWADMGIVREVDRKTIANLNLGTEAIFDQAWTLRVGLFTDFSSAPAVKPSPQAQLTRMNRYGASLSVGYQSEGYDITIGAMGSLGSGEASVYHFDAAPQEQWQPARTEERVIYVFIAGVQKAVIDTAKGWWNDIWDKSNEKKEGGAKRGEGELKMEEEKPAGGQAPPPSV